MNFYSIVIVLSAIFNLLSCAKLDNRRSRTTTTITPITPTEFINPSTGRLNYCLLRILSSCFIFSHCLNANRCFVIYYTFTFPYHSMMNLKFIFLNRFDTGQVPTKSKIQRFRSKESR